MRDQYLGEQCRKRQKSRHGRDGRSMPWEGRVGTAPPLQSAALMNVVVYVSDALRTDHLGCYGARYVNTKTIDELAAGGVRYSHAISAAPWTAPSTTSIVTGMYAHHHGYLHWDAQLDPSIETWFRAFSAHGYEVASFVFDTNYLFKDLPEANVLGTSETLDGAFEWLRANRESPFFLYVHNWATHMPYDILHADRKDWLAAKTEIIDGIQSDSASALDSMRESYRAAVERQSEVLVASFLEELESLGLRENTVVRVPLRPRRVVGRALRGEGRGQGRLPHARRDALRRDRRGAADPLGPRTARAGRRLVAGALGRSHADAARARGTARARDRRRVAAPTSTATGRRSSPAPTWGRSRSSPSASRRGS